MLASRISPIAPSVVWVVIGVSSYIDKVEEVFLSVGFSAGLSSLILLKTCYLSPWSYGRSPDSALIQVPAFTLSC